MSITTTTTYYIEAMNYITGEDRITVQDNLSYEDGESLIKKLFEEKVVQTSKTLHYKNGKIRGYTNGEWLEPNQSFTVFDTERGYTLSEIKTMN